MSKDAPFPAPESETASEEGTVFDPRFDKDGLLPVVTTSAKTGEVLMLAYMNAEALARTIETGEAHYWSRSRGRLWRKGEERATRNAWSRCAPIATRMPCGSWSRRQAPRSPAIRVAGRASIARFPLGPGHEAPSPCVSWTRSGNSTRRRFTVILVPQREP